MTPVEFVDFRKKMAKTQRELAAMLGVSLKAVHSYEQGWRRIPSHVERQIIFLLTCKTTGPKNRKYCWTIKKCSLENRRKCPVWELRAGRWCWMIGGHYCHGSAQSNSNTRMRVCRECEIMRELV